MDIKAAVERIKSTLPDDFALSDNEIRRLVKTHPENFEEEPDDEDR